MAHVRVVLALSPELLQSVVEGLLRGEEEIRVLAKLPDSSQAIRFARRVRPDVLVVGQSTAGLPIEYRDLLVDLPTLRIIAVAGDARSATIFELRLHQLHVEEFSPADLLGAIRSPPPPLMH